jgi:hypothetical protein
MPHPDKSLREALYLDRRAEGVSMGDAAQLAGLGLSRTQLRKVEEDGREYLEQKRNELLRSRGELVPAVQEIESGIINQVRDRVKDGKKLDRVEMELASKTIQRVDRAVGVDEPERGSSLAFVAIQVGQLIQQQVNFSGDAVPVEKDEPPDEGAA